MEREPAGYRAGYSVPSREEESRDELGSVDECLDSLDSGVVRKYSNLPPVLNPFGSDRFSPFPRVPVIMAEMKVLPLNHLEMATV